MAGHEVGADDNFTKYCQDIGINQSLMARLRKVLIGMRISFSRFRIITQALCGTGSLASQIVYSEGSPPA